MSVEARYLQPDLPEELNVAYRRTFERLLHHFRIRGIGREEAADMAQEAAVRAFLHVRRWGMSGENLDPLINRIARNMLIDRQRRGGPEIVGLDHVEPVGDPAQDPTERVVARQKQDALRQAVGTLPERHRDAIVYSLDGMTPAQIGERMGIGRNAADALLHRARRRLRDHLDTIGETAFGLAVLVHARLQSFARSSGTQPGLSEAGSSIIAGSVATAAAALVIVIGGGTPTMPTMPAGVAPTGTRATAIAPAKVMTSPHAARNVADARPAVEVAQSDDGVEIRTPSPGGGSGPGPAPRPPTGGGGPARRHSVAGVDYAVVCAAAQGSCASGGIDLDRIG